jgi:hypothetical protein
MSDWQPISAVPKNGSLFYVRYGFDNPIEIPEPARWAADGGIEHISSWGRIRGVATAWRPYSVSGNAPNLRAVKAAALIEAAEAVATHWGDDVTARANAS